MRYAAHRIVRNEYPVPSKTVAVLDIEALLTFEAAPLLKLVAWLVHHAAGTTTWPGAPGPSIRPSGHHENPLAQFVGAARLNQLEQPQCSVDSRLALLVVAPGTFYVPSLRMLVLRDDGQSLFAEVPLPQLLSNLNLPDGYLVAVLLLKHFKPLAEGLPAGYLLEAAQIGEVPTVLFQQPINSVRLFGNSGLGESAQIVSTEDRLLCGELASRSRVLHKIENPVARENVHDLQNVLRVIFQLQLGAGPFRIGYGTCYCDAPLVGVRSALAGQPPEVVRRRLRIALVLIFILSSADRSGLYG